jgi:hypothetical protein
VLIMRRPAQKKKATARMAGLWLPNAEDMNPKRRGPTTADDLPTME